MVLNGSDKQIVIDDILLDDINEHFDGLNQANSECSHLVADAPPPGPAFYFTVSPAFMAGIFFVA